MCQLVETGFFDTHRLKQLQCLVRLELGELGFRFGVKENRLGRRNQITQRSDEINVGQLPRVDVEDVQERLGRHQMQLAQRLWIEPGAEHRPAFFENRLGLAHRSHDRLLVLLDPGFLLQPRQRLLDCLHIGEESTAIRQFIGHYV